jgi:hypothetical protein
MACAIAQPRSGIFPKNASGLDGVVASRGALESGFIFEPTLDVEVLADQAPIQLDTLSPVASHDLFA